MKARAPMTTALLDFFPDALAEVAEVSALSAIAHNAVLEDGTVVHRRGDGPHNDHANSLLRHMVRRGETDKDGLRHTAKVAWRALALLQEELERDYAQDPTFRLPRAAVLEPQEVPQAARRPPLHELKLDIDIPGFLREPRAPDNPS